MKFRFDPSLIAVATATYYPKWYRGKLKSLKHTDKIRGDLALELVQTAKNSGFKVVIADDKSSKSFRRALYKIDGIKIIKRRSIGYSQGRRKAIEAAVKLGIKVIVLTEPEKLSLIGSIPQIARPILDGQADIVVPKREQKLFEKSYTDYQYESETEGNSLYNENLRVRNLLSAKDQDLDLLFGPRVIKNDKKNNFFIYEKI